TAGLALLFALFLLLQQNDMSDRVIRLLGTENLSDTSGAMTEAGSRLSKLFLAQATINTGFGIVIGVGLWLIGLPGVLVWGIIAAMSRFVPFIGALLAAIPPIVIAAGIEPGWSAVIATVILFLVCEILAANVIEPLVLGHQVGLTPLSMVLAASFWSLIWGPVGLLLSAPLTMTFVVLGRYMAGLSFLSVLLGDEAPLTRAQELYRRLLSRDSISAASQIEDAIEESSVSKVADSVVLPALNLAAVDEREGRLEPRQLAFVGESLVEMSDLVDALSTEPRSTETGRVLVVPARGDIDAAMSTVLARMISATTERPASVPARMRGLSALTASDSKDGEGELDAIVVATAGAVPPRQLRLISE
ncbi:MAG: AI-2E family transporter, partial [Proteobacteria bacterium]|nr:AI-2E family transporter [Pseudomonadota bacterium]